MKQLMTCGLLLAVLGCAAAGWADAPPAPVTLQQCVDTALRQQTDVLVGAANLEAARQRERQTLGSRYPTLSVSSTQNVLDSNDNAGIGGVGGIGTGSRDNNNTSLALSHTFYDGGLRDARIVSAKAGTKQNVAALDRTRQTVIFSVTRNYLALLRAQRLAEVSDKRVEYLEGQLKLIKARIDAGDAAAVEAFPVEAQLANARVDQLSAKNSIRTSTIALQLAMGLTPGGAFPVTDVTLPATLPTVEMEPALARALTQRPDLRQTAAGVETARATVKTAKINKNPRPTLSGSAGQPLFEGDTSTYSINAGISFNIFDAGQNNAAYKEAQTGLNSARLREAQTKKDITSDVTTAYLNLENAEQRLQATDLSTQASQKNFDAQQARYGQGLATPLDLLNAQLELTTAQSNAVQARYDYLTALAQLHFAMGAEGVVTWE